jgi:hypothetical protein
MAARPPSQFNLLQGTNGSPVYLGTIVSTGAVQNNLTTGTPFASVPRGPTNQPVTSPPSDLALTLAGRVLLLQPSAAGVFLPSTNPNVAVNAVPGQLIVALQTVVPPLNGTAPGVSLAAAERVVVTMGPQEGWLQWLPLTGSANLLVWELR